MPVLNILALDIFEAQSLINVKSLQKPPPLWLSLLHICLQVIEGVHVPPQGSSQQIKMSLFLLEPFVRILKALNIPLWLLGHFLEPFLRK